LPIQREGGKVWKAEWKELRESGDENEAEEEHGSFTGQDAGTGDAVA